MADNLPVLDGAGVVQSLKSTASGAGPAFVHTIWHLEDADQRAALLAALVGTGLGMDQKVVTTAAAIIVPARPGRREVTIFLGEAGTPLYFGGAALTLANGAKTPGVEGYQLTLKTGAAIYGMVAGGTLPISYAEVF